MRTRACALLLSAALLPSLALSEELTLDVANDWARATIAACRNQGHAVTVAYMGPDGELRLLARGDGAPARTLDIARRKAYTVIKTGKTSGDFGASVAPPAGAAPAAPVPGALPGQVPGKDVDTNLIIWAGGLPVMRGSVLLGAVSVSGAPGGDKDEACAKAGLEAIRATLTAAP
jgi:uncharacterized protein GlcG (DUF336 family)